MTIKLYDVVKTREVQHDSLGDRVLPAGSEGTVVLVHLQPEPAYEVEFLDDQGRTIALLTLLPDQVQEANAA